MLTILIRTQLSSLFTLADVCYTKANYGATAIYVNNTLSVNTPRGVLGGSVAAVDTAGNGGGDYVAVPGGTANAPVGLFVNDCAGAAFDNAPAVASGKVAVIKGLASVEVDVYETQLEADPGTAVTYAVSLPLFCSAQGFLTADPATVNTTLVGICTKMPTTASPTLGLDMRI